MSCPKSADSDAQTGEFLADNGVLSLGSPTPDNQNQLGPRDFWRVEKPRAAPNRKVAQEMQVVKGFHTELKDSNNQLKYVHLKYLPEKRRIA